MVVFAVKTMSSGTGLPPVARLNQPLKRKPDRLGVGGPPTSLPSWPTCADGGLTMAPTPLGLKVTVMASHCAKIVVFCAKTVPAAPVVMGAPPVAASNQPRKVWPPHVGMGRLDSLP